MNDISSRITTRRHFLQLTGAASAGLVLPVVGARSSRASRQQMDAAIAEVTGGKAVRSGRITLDLPPLSENGNGVSCGVAVESPMTAEDHVRAVHVFAEKNPQPRVVSARFGPHNGRARITTRIRLADSQDVVAIAELSDGSFWSDRIHVVVTLGACVEEVL